MASMNMKEWNCSWY